MALNRFQLALVFCVLFELVEGAIATQGSSLSDTDTHARRPAITLRRARRNIAHGEIAKGKRELLQLISSSTSAGPSPNQSVELECLLCLADTEKSDEKFVYLERALKAAKALYGTNSARCVPILERLYMLKESKGTDAEVERSEVVRDLVALKHSVLNATPDERLVEVRLRCLRARGIRTNADVAELERLLKEIQTEPSILLNQKLSDLLLSVVSLQPQRAASLSQTFVPVLRRRRGTAYNTKRNLGILVAWHTFHERLGTKGSNYFDAELTSFIRTSKISSNEMARLILGETEKVCDIPHPPRATAALLLQEFEHLPPDTRKNYQFRMLTALSKAFTCESFYQNLWQCVMRNCVADVEHGVPNLSELAVLARAAQGKESLWAQVRPVLAKVNLQRIAPTGDQLVDLGELALYTSAYAPALASPYLTKVICSFRQGDAAQLQRVAATAAGAAMRLYGSPQDRERARSNCHLIIAALPPLLSAPEPTLTGLADLNTLAQRGILDERDKQAVRSMLWKVLNRKLAPTEPNAWQLTVVLTAISQLPTDEALELRLVEEIGRMLQQCSIEVKASVRNMLVDASTHAALQEVLRGRPAVAMRILTTAERCVSACKLTNQEQSARMLLSILLLSVREDASLIDVQSLNRLETLLSHADTTVNQDRVWDSLNILPAEQLARAISILEAATASRSRLVNEAIRLHIKAATLQVP